MVPEEEVKKYQPSPLLSPVLPTTMSMPQIQSFVPPPPMMPIQPPPPAMFNADPTNPMQGIKLMKYFELH